MIYLDNGATTLHKPRAVTEAMHRALMTCGNPGRGGHAPAVRAARTVFRCREQAARLFDCSEEQVAFTSNCTHGLNIAIHSLLKPGDPVVISGFEHNAVTRPLHAMGAKTVIAGRRLFDPADTLECFEAALKKGMKAAVFTHVSNVFGYILPVSEMAELCKKYGVPFILDAAQSAGVLDISMKELGAAFIAMPGHKGLLGPQGTGILLCGAAPVPLLQGGTGSMSASQEMPKELPDALEAGTVNVPGIAGLCAGMAYVHSTGTERIRKRENCEAMRCAAALRDMGFKVFTGQPQAGTVSFLPGDDCEDFAQALAQLGIAVRAGLHCAPTAHKSAGTLETGTVRVSFGHDAAPWQTDRFLQALKAVTHKKYFS